MNIFERLSRLIFPHLDEDERTEILRNLSDYEADLSCLENQYITFADRKAFTEKWNPVVTKIKSKRIPKRDETYAPVCNFLGAYSDINTAIIIKGACLFRDLVATTQAAIKEQGNK